MSHLSPNLPVLEPALQPAAAPSERRLSMDSRIMRALVGLRRLHRHGKPVNLADFFRHFGASSLVLITALLALPFVSPVLVGPLTTPASLLIILFSWQFLKGHDRPSLPHKFLSTPYPERAHRVLSWMMVRLLRFKRWISRPRFPHLVAGPRGRVLCSLGMLTGGVLLLVPMPMVPGTNTFPAMGIALFAFGWLERDGLITMLGALANLIGFVFLAALALLGTEALALLWNNLTAHLA